MKRHMSVTLIGLSVISLVIWLSRERVAQAQSPNMPIGSVIAWSGPKTKIPAGWLECDGRDLNRTTFQDLFNAIGTTWGGTATDKFKVPDLRGYFLRGVDDGAGRDPDVKAAAPNGRTPVGNGPVDSAGSIQQDQVIKHVHQYELIQGPGFGGASGETGFDRPGKSTDTSSFGGSETRPKNAYVYFIIRAK